MPEGNRKFVIDDNSLFILLTLKYQGEIYIKGIQTVYDYETNYDDTVATPSYKNPFGSLPDIQDFSKTAINWMTEHAGAVFLKFNDTFSLGVHDRDELENLLNDYLSEFTASEYYHSKEAHRRAFYEFIKTTKQDLLKFKGKYFTYCFTQGQQYKNKYKMIEYIAYLMQEGFLEPYGNIPFDFNNDGKEGLKKVIGIAFVENKALELFEDLLREDKQKIYTEQYTNNPPLLSKGVFELRGNIVGCTATGEELSLTGGYGRYLKIVEHCLSKEITSISVDDYKKKFYKKRLEEFKPRTARDYFGQINRLFKDKLKIDFDFLENSGRDGEWEIYTKPL